MERYAGQIANGLPEIIEDIQKRKQQMQEELFKYQMQNPPDPYHPKENPTLPDYPGGRPTGSGDWAYNKSQYQNIAGLPGNDLGIVGNQIKNGNPFGLVGEALGVKLF